MRRAADVLRAGGLVAFPTETVYGVGADATNAAAVAKIFAAKGRPSTNPLIVHVADVDSARRYASEWPGDATRLAEQFWPGPLTLVVPKTSAIVDSVTAGRQTVALRVPDHALALELLGAFGGPVAAPSANKSNHVSPTTAAHVVQELGGTVDVILDGGPCRVGIESTVVDLTGPRPVIFRPGGVPRLEVEAVVGPVDVFGGAVDAAESSASPGQHARHYAPRTPAFRVPFDRSAFTPGQCGVIMPGRRREWRQVRGIRLAILPSNPDEYARLFYSTLRELDRLGLNAIYIGMPPERPEWEAVRDRITRATRPLGGGAGAEG